MTDHDTQRSDDAPHPNASPEPAAPDSRGPIDDLETAVGDGESPAATCAYCGREFADTEGHDLHVGERHADACTPAERDAAEAAAESERDELFYFHLRVVAAIAVLYTVVVLLYMIALGSGLL